MHIPNAVGIHVMLPKKAKRKANDPSLDRILRVAVGHDRPSPLCWDNLDVGTALIGRYADTRFMKSATICAA